MVFPLLVDTGSYIIKLDTSKFTKTIDEGVETIAPTQGENEGVTKSLENSIEQGTKELTQAIKEGTQNVINEEIKNKVEETTTQIKEAIKEQTSTENKGN